MASGIVCPEQPAADVGRDVLVGGGNAMDAAVAAAFAQAVTNPLECGLGGTGLLHYYDAAERRGHVLNCGVTIGSRPIPRDWAATLAGRAETVGRYFLQSRENQLGYRAVMTPGFVRGCWAGFHAFGSGRLAWSEVLSPAVRLAREGFQVYSHIASLWRNPEMYPNRHLMETLRATTEASRLFLKPDGGAFSEGDVLVQPELAATLERLAQVGADDFYTGEIGAVIADDFATNGGFITAEDLREYQVLEEQPLRGTYRRFDVTSTAAPSGGSDLVQMLNILEHFDLRALRHNSPEYVYLFSRVQRATFADAGRLKGMDQPAAEPLERELLRPERARSWVERIAHGDPIVVRAGAALPFRGTTHLTCVDEHGNVVCFTHSIGTLGGSGVVTQGLGFLYNDLLGHYNPVAGRPNSMLPGKRLHGGLPSIIFREGVPFLALGAPGGSRLITSTAQVIVNVIDHGMDMASAVSAPRFHSEQDRVVFLEPTFPEATAEALRTMGEDVRRSPYMSRVQAIRLGADIELGLEAEPDPRGSTARIV